ncbi:unannotated protein [freshwater metagenome]|uniref:Unannotated protein n=1 Tax=freshwater metagenome TaxID=449393 RepID=A0A6J6RNX7_9ZZZZ
MLLNLVCHDVALNLLELQSRRSRLMPPIRVMNFQHLYLILLSILQPKQLALNAVAGFQQWKHLRVQLRFRQLFEVSDVPRVLVGIFHHYLNLHHHQISDYAIAHSREAVLNKALQNSLNLNFEILQNNCSTCEGCI